MDLKAFVQKGNGHDLVRGLVRGPPVQMVRRCRGGEVFRIAAGIEEEEEVFVKNYLFRILASLGIKIGSKRPEEDRNIARMTEGGSHANVRECQLLIDE
jgi:hypothetical protein